MKPINAETVLRSFVGWVSDFQKDHGRFPESLESLAKNKDPRHDYDPGRAISRLRSQGFSVSFDNFGDTVELKVQKDDILLARKLP